MAYVGVFADAVDLTYQTASVSGQTSVASEFNYNPSEEITFSIGGLVFGSCVSKPLLAISELVSLEISYFDPRLVNRARLLYSLTPGQGFEKAIRIDEEVEKVVAKHASDVDFDSEDLSKLDKPLQNICDELHL